MGRPLNKKFFGDPSGPGLQLSVDVWFTGKGSAETGWIVRQRGVERYEITNGVLTETLKLQNGLPSSEGQASMTVNPFGTTGATATPGAIGLIGEGSINTIGVNTGCSEYLSAPTITITGAGNGATATAVLTGDAVTSVIVDTGGSGYVEPSVSFTAPTGGDLEFVRTILSHGVKTHQGNVYTWSTLTASTTGQSDLPLS